VPEPVRYLGLGDHEACRAKQPGTAQGHQSVVAGARADERDPAVHISHAYHSR